MQKQFKTALLLSLVFLISTVVTVSGQVSENTVYSEIDILLVNDGHTIYDEDEDFQYREFEVGSETDRKLYSKYLESLKTVPNANIENYNTTEEVEGPDAEKMAEYDLIVWYRLSDEIASEIDEDTDDFECGACSKLSSNELEEIRNYLNEKNGRLFLTGQTMDYSNELGEETAIIVPEDIEDESDIVMRNIGHWDRRTVAEGEDTEYKVDSSLSSKIDRVFISHICELEEFQEKNTCQNIINSQTTLLPHNESGDGYYTGYHGNDEFLIGLLTHNERPRYKTVYMSEGFETIKTEETRKNLMKNIVNFLLGTRTKDMSVKDSKGGIVDADGKVYDQHTNSTINIQAVCEAKQKTPDGQKHNLTDARFFYSPEGEDLGPSIETGFEKKESIEDMESWDTTGITGDEDFTEISDKCGVREGENSLHLYGGNRESSYEVETSSIDLSHQKENRNVTFSYSIYLPTGEESAECYAPNSKDEHEEVSEDELIAEYIDENGDWQQLKLHGASEINSKRGEWLDFNIVLPEEAIHEETQLRFNPMSTDDSYEETIFGEGLTEVSDEGDTWVLDDVVLDDGIRLNPVDGEFNSSKEKVEFKEFNATDVRYDIENPDGTNFTYGVQCRDSTKHQKWSKFDKSWITAALEPPIGPESEDVEIHGSEINGDVFTNKEINNFSIDIRQLEENKPDMIRFSCQPENGKWSDWKTFDEDFRNTNEVTETSVPVNITDHGCGIDDGEKEIYAELSTFSGNLQDETQQGNDIKASIILDTTPPKLEEKIPENRSYINESQFFLLDAYDPDSESSTASGIEETGFPYLYSDVETNGTFVLNEFFHPEGGEFQESGEKSITAWIWDRLENTLKVVVEFFVDAEDPYIKFAEPGNETVHSSDGFTANGEGLINITIKESNTNLSYIGVHNGDSWIENVSDVQDSEFSFDYSENNGIDPGWIDEGEKELKVWFNDSVGHVVEETFIYYIDESPPVFLEELPANRSYLSPDQEITVFIEEGGFADIETVKATLGDETEEIIANESFDPSMFSEWDDEGTEDIWHSINIEAVDEVGNKDSISLEYNTDSLDPEVGLEFSGENYLNESGKAFIEIDSEISDLSHIGVYNGEEWILNESKVLEKSFTDSLTPGWEDEGLNKLKLFVNDTAGNEKTLEKSRYLDKTPPIVENVLPSLYHEKDGTKYVTEDTTIELDVEDPDLGETSISGSGEDKLVFNLDSSQNSSAISLENTVEISPEWVDGENTLNIYVNDSVGNTRHIDLDFFSDNEPPEITDANIGEEEFPGQEYDGEEIDALVVPYPSLEFEFEDVPQDGSGIEKIVFYNGSHETEVSVGERETTEIYEPKWYEEDKDDWKTQLEVFISDKLGNNVTETYNYVVDNKAPETTLQTSYDWGWTDSDVSFDLVAQDNIEDNVDYISYCIIEDESESQCEEQKSVEAVDTLENLEVSCEDGETCEKYIGYWANDSVGHIEDTNFSDPIKIDKEPPEIQIKNPENDSYVGGTVEFIVEAFDKGSGTESVEFTIYNKTSDEELIILNSSEEDGWTEIENGEWFFELDTEDFGEPEINDLVFNVTSQDNLGHIKEKFIGFDVDNMAPALSIDYLPDKIHHSETFEASVVAERPGNVDLKNHTYRIINQSDSQEIYSETVEPESGYHEFEFDISPENSGSDHELEDGEYIIETEAYDDPDDEEMDQETRSNERIFVIDTESPELIMTDPGNETWQKENINIESEISDLYGLRECRYSYKNESMDEWSSEFELVECPDVSGTTKFDFDSRNVCGDSVEPDCGLKLEVEDLAGNVESEQMNFKIDNTPPIISFTGPDDSKWYNEEFEVELGFDDQRFIEDQKADYRVSDGGQQGGWEELQIEDNMSSFDVECLSEGEEACNVEVKTSSYSGLETLESVDFNIDRTPPEFESISVANRSNITSETEFEVVFEDGLSGVDSSKTFYSNGSDEFMLESGEKFNPGWDEGENELEIVLTDNAGNINALFFEFVVDDTSPVVEDIRFDNDKEFLNNTAIRPETEFLIDAYDEITGIKQSFYERAHPYGVENFEVNDSFNHIDWEDDEEGYRWLNFTLKDFVTYPEPNAKTEKYLFFVDGRSPEVLLEHPEEGREIDMESENIKILSWDTGVGIREDNGRKIGNYYHEGIGEWSSFSINESFYPYWDEMEEGEREIKIRVEDKLGNVEEKEYSFTLIGSPPDIGEIEVNRSFARSDHDIKVSTDVFHEYSEIDTVNMVLEDKNDEIIGSKEMENIENDRYGTSINIAEEFGNPELEPQNVSITVEANNSVGYEEKRPTDQLRIDDEPPKSSEHEIHVLNDPEEERKIYRNQKFEFSSLVEDSTRVEEVLATIKSPDTKQNVSMELKEGDKEQGVWKTDFNQTERTGTYEITDIYSTDLVGNLDAREVNKKIYVVNHTIKTLLNDDNKTHAAHEEDITIVNDLNKTLKDPEITLDAPSYLNPVTNQKEMLYENITEFECFLNNEDESCSITYFNSSKGTITVKGDGEGDKINLTSKVTAPATEKDEKHTWRSIKAGNIEKTETKVFAPDLRIEEIYCDGETLCEGAQGEKIEFIIQVNNEEGENHSGNIDTDVFLTSLEDEIFYINSSEKYIKSGENVNFSFDKRVEEAGKIGFLAEVMDKTRSYHQDKETVLTIEDTEKPRLDFFELETNTTIVNTSIRFGDILARDNKNINEDDGIEKIEALVENPEGEAENVTVSEQLTERYEELEVLSYWRHDYKNIPFTGVYNIKNVYITDHAGNTKKEEINKTFQAVDLDFNVTSLPNTLSVEEEVVIGANVSGAAAGIENIFANVSRPREENVLLELEQSKEGKTDYKTVFQDTVMSGQYNINASLVAGPTIHDQSDFHVAYGSPSTKNAKGNSTHIVLPKDHIDDKINLTWRVNALKGDIEDVTTSIETDDLVDVHGPQEKNIGDIYYEKGYELVSYEIEPLSTGNGVIKFDTETGDHEKTHEISLLVRDEDYDSPYIKEFEERPKEVNKGDDVNIFANISDSGPLKNVDIVVEHPDGYQEDPEDMELIKQDLYRHYFVNTTKTGVYSYTVTAEDYSGNEDTKVSNSFNVTERYDVDVETDHEIYMKNEEVNVEIDVMDVNERKVDGFEATVILDNSEENITLADQKVTDTLNYYIDKDHPPSSGEKAEYELYVNVSKNGNHGFSTEKFEVSNMLDIDVISPEHEEHIEDGDEVYVRAQITNQRGDPVTRGYYSAECVNCAETNSRLLPVSGHPGVYHTTFSELMDSSPVTIRGSDLNGNSVLEGLYVYSGEQEEIAEEGGNGAAPPETASLEIEQLSPDFTLPSHIDEANITVETDQDAECRYGKKLEESNYSKGVQMETEDSRIHTSMVPLDGPGEYHYDVLCEAEGEFESEVITFILEEADIEDFEISLMDQIGPIQQGEEVSSAFSIYNSGTETIYVDINTDSDCCDTWVERNNEITREMVVEEGEQISHELIVDVPLKAEEGAHDIYITFVTGDGLTRETSVVLIVAKRPAIVHLEELERQKENLSSTLERYRELGIDTEALFEHFNKFEEEIEKAHEAIERNDEISLSRTVDSANTIKNELEAKITAKELEYNIRENWDKWLLMFVFIYTAFFLITMVFIPYFRLKSEYINTHEKLDHAVDARKKAEKQYFNRQIDRETFMNIMKGRQDEVLELRSEIEELEEKLDKGIRRNFTLSNYFKAPAKATRQIIKFVHTLSERKNQNNKNE